MNDNEKQLVKKLYEDYIELAHNAGSSPCGACKWQGKNKPICVCKNKTDVTCKLFGQSEFEYINDAEIRELIGESDTKTVEIDTLFEGHSWRVCGILDKHYDWTAKGWIDSWVLSEPNPFVSCHCCNKVFDDDEILYQGFFTVDDHNNQQLFSLCRKCAYEISDRVTDYELLTDGNIKLVEYIKERK